MAFHGHTLGYLPDTPASSKTLSGSTLLEAMQTGVELSIAKKRTILHSVERGLKLIE